jgi:very-short-patch-repair endonuclease
VISNPERLLLLHLRAAGLPEPFREYRFAPPRRWRFDFAWPAAMLAVEVEGGAWIYGRHVRGRGFEADCEKYNAATLLGWRVLRFTPVMVENGAALCAVETLFPHLRERAAEARKLMRQGSAGKPPKTPDAEAARTPGPK